MTDSAVPNLPVSLAALRPLALNLRWSWHRRTRLVFNTIDPELWRASGHNPIALLADVPAARLEELASDAAFLLQLKDAAENLEDYVRGDDTWYGRTYGNTDEKLVGYFSAEFGITECLRIFSGGLGVLSGDHLKSASDLGVPLVAIGLFYSEGYFIQQIDTDGTQRDAYVATDPGRLPLSPVVSADGAPLLISFPLADHDAHARIWRVDVGRVPLYLLDTNVPENTPEDRRITDRLYGGDNEHRLQQEIALGIGGVRAMRAVGREPAVIHLNEGHAAFAAVERARGRQTETETFRDVATRVAAGVVFTTHTPVAAGHDYFPNELLEPYLKAYMREMREPWERFYALGRTSHDGRFCMTALAMRLSWKRNGVSKLHGVVSRTMWHDIWPDVHVDEVPITHITNGVHLPTWIGAEVGELFADRIGPQWQIDGDEVHWHRATHIPLDELWNARLAQRTRMVGHARRYLTAETRRRGDDAEWCATALNPEALTIVFARRFATYKRATLLLSQPDRLAELLLSERKPTQFIFAGKAHPRDLPGQALLKQIAQFSRRPDFRGRFIFLEGYDVELARHLVQGADVWLNVPLRPYEASGTSGMKAAANGALNLSIPDGWWAEAWEEHNRLPEPIGWSIDAGVHAESVDLSGPEAGRIERDRADADALFAALEEEVVPLFYRQTNGIGRAWAGRMRSTIRQCAGFFNTHRMVRDYVEDAYRPAAEASGPNATTPLAASNA